MKKCKVCLKEFQPNSNNQKYCSKECQSVAYKNYKFSSEEATNKYREKIKEEEGIDDTEFNFKFREKTANNKGMTTTEYNRYLEERKAEKLGLSVKELRHFTYLAKKNNSYLYEELGISPKIYYAKLKRKI